MKSLLTSLAIFTAISGFSQLSEDLIPKQAVSVFSLNNINLLQKISLDDLVKYEFMEEVQQELFDGSTRGKTIKDPRKACKNYSFNYKNYCSSMCVRKNAVKAGKNSKITHQRF